jgi:hypothetical protein
MSQKRTLILIAILLTGVPAFPQTDSLHGFFKEGTALTLPKKKAEFRFYGYSGYGLTDRIEIDLHPLMFWILPQVKAKIRINKNPKYILTTEHELEYPTMFLRTISRKGIGGIISPEFSFPQMVGVYNGIIISHPLASGILFTAKTGIQLSIKSKKPDARSTIDLPILYPHFAAYYHNPVLIASVDLRRDFSSSVGGQFNITGYLVPGSFENIFIENRGYLSWTKKKFQLKAGYLLCYGQYTYDSDWHLLPSMEIVKDF